MGIPSTKPNADTGAEPRAIELLGDLAGFFKENVARVLALRNLEPPESTTRYLAGLLAGLSHERGPIGDSLVELELEAREAPKSSRFEKLKLLGDHALSYAGLFDAHRERRGLSPSYVEDVGTRAYRGAFAIADQRAAPSWDLSARVFLELSTNFATYRDVLDDVRESTCLGTSNDVLSLYERYVKTHSPTLRERLLAHGVFALETEAGEEVA